jgi:hypothetical protein
MKEQVLEIINNRINNFLSSPIDRQKEIASEEITGHIFQFIEYLQEENWSKYKKLDWWVKKDNKIPPKNPPFTLNELYNFWYSNVYLKTKKG